MSISYAIVHEMKAVVQAEIKIENIADLATLRTKEGVSLFNCVRVRVRLSPALPQLVKQLNNADGNTLSKHLCTLGYN